MRSRRSVLLLELIVAMVILSMTLVGILDGFTAAGRAAAAQSRMRVGRLLAEQKIYELESQGVFAPGLAEGRFAAPSGFQWTVATTQTRVPALYRLEVTVSWPGDAIRAVAYLRERTGEP